MDIKYGCNMVEVAKHRSSSEPVVTLTAAAHDRVLSYLDSIGKHGLQLSLQKTGCSGLSYAIDYVDEAEADDVVIDVAPGKFICIPKKSLPYLKGVTVDYAKQGINQKFVFINPNQTGQCGCGESFTVDDL